MTHDAGLAHDPRILALLADPTAPPTRRHRAAFAYACALGWSASHGTDGRIPASAVPFVHASRSVATLLVDHGLWETDPKGFLIPSVRDRVTADAAQTARSRLRLVAGLDVDDPDAEVAR